jgi:hypothetical protein
MNWEPESRLISCDCPPLGRKIFFRECRPEKIAGPASGVAAMFAAVIDLRYMGKAAEFGGWRQIIPMNGIGTSTTRRGTYQVSAALTGGQRRLMFFRDEVGMPAFVDMPSGRP